MFFNGVCILGKSKFAMPIADWILHSCSYNVYSYMLIFVCLFACLQIRKKKLHFNDLVFLLHVT